MTIIWIVIPPLEGSVFRWHDNDLLCHTEIVLAWQWLVMSYRNCIGMTMTWYVIPKLYWHDNVLYCHTEIVLAWQCDGMSYRSKVVWHYLTLSYWIKLNLQVICHAMDCHTENCSMTMSCYVIPISISAWHKLTLSYWSLV